MTRRSWRTLICRLRGHAWQVADIPGYRADGQVYLRGRRRFCTRCPARVDVTGQFPRVDVTE